MYVHNSNVTLGQQKKNSSEYGKIINHLRYLQQYQSRIKNLQQRCCGCYLNLLGAIQYETW